MDALRNTGAIPFRLAKTGDSTHNDSLLASGGAVEVGGLGGASDDVGCVDRRRRRGFY